MTPAKLLRFVLAFCLVAPFALSPAAARRRPAPSAPAGAAQANEVERKVNALLAQMTLEEKLGQLQQLDGHADGRFREEHVELTRKGLLGSTLNVRGAKQSNELQRPR